VIVYLDTSALVKVYVEEEGSDIVKRTIEKASLVATSIVAYAEARAALSRCLYEKIFSNDDYHRCIIDLKSDWERYFKLNISQSLIDLAGELTQLCNIRGFDAIHLASAITLQQQTGSAVTFVCWDARLWNAANKEKFIMVPDRI